jgi:Sulfotransferase domain
LHYPDHGRKVPSVSIEVSGAGFGRTGTMSLKVALETLGIDPCYHMIAIFEYPEHVPVWEEEAQGKPVDREQDLTSCS